MIVFPSLVQKKKSTEYAGKQAVILLYKVSPDTGYPAVDTVNQDGYGLIKSSEKGSRA